ncbi:MAG: hypothetical protein ACK40H_07640, partial [Sphingomonadaceae bacterium]
MSLLARALRCPRSDCQMVIGTAPAALQPNHVPQRLPLCALAAASFSGRTGALTALAFGGPEGETRDKVFVYRNVFDLR